MALELTPYLEQKAVLPPTGRQIIAQYDDESIVVYQAYRPSIGRFAAAHGYFGEGFSLGRMTWIKPGFLWMMYRCGWATKVDQEAVLAIWLKRSAFEEVLCQAVLSTFHPGLWATHEEWRRDVSCSPVRLQWDPDHMPTGAPVERRAIQLGLRGSAVRAYAGDPLISRPSEWLMRIEDITDFVREQHQHVLARDHEQLLVPREAVYPVTDAELIRRLDMGS